MAVVDIKILFYWSLFLYCSMPPNLISKGKKNQIFIRNCQIITALMYIIRFFFSFYLVTDGHQALEEAVMVVWKAHATMTATDCFALSQNGTARRCGPVCLPQVPLIMGACWQSSPALIRPRECFSFRQKTCRHHFKNLRCVLIRRTFLKPYQKYCTNLRMLFLLWSSSCCRLLQLSFVSPKQHFFMISIISNPIFCRSRWKQKRAETWLPGLAPLSTWSALPRLRKACEKYSRWRLEPLCKSARAGRKVAARCCEPLRSTTT